MPALAKYLIVICFLTIPVSAEAQITKLFGREKSSSPAQRQQSRLTLQQSSAIRQAQFGEEMLPPASSEGLPYPEPSMPFSQPAALAPVTDPSLGAPAPPSDLGLGPIETSPSDYIGGTPSEYPAVQQPMASQPAMDAYSNEQYPFESSPIGESMPVESGTVQQAQPVYESSPVYEYETPSDGILHSGQPFDLPISDALSSEVAETFSTNNWFRGGRWYSRQDLMLMIRADLPHVHIAFDQSQNFAGVTSTGLPDVHQMGSFNTQRVDFTYEAGTRLTLGKILGRDVGNRDHGIEFTFFGLFDYTGRATAVPVNPDSGLGLRSLLASNEARATSTQAGSLAVGFPVLNFVDAFLDSTSQTMNYFADFNSMELNYTIGGRPARDRLVMQPDGRWVRHATPSRIRAIYAGIRYIRQNELFEYRGNERNFLDAAGNQTPIAEENGLYRVTTDNDLFGFQIGAEAVKKQTDWVLGFNGKLGGLLNFADRDSLLSQTFADSSITDIVTRRQTESLNDETLTFLAEASVNFAYYVRPNTAFRVGYNVLYLNGMATATNNIGLISGFKDFEVTGDSLYHGANAGFEMTW